jgi:hypothetical protein
MKPGLRRGGPGELRPSIRTRADAFRPTGYHQNNTAERDALVDFHMKLQKEGSAIGLFASASERLNDFARSLRMQSAFSKVKSPADIRQFEDGWRLQKWVEAELDSSEGLWAEWWLEVRPSSDGGWILESSLSVSPDGIFIGLQEANVHTLDELERYLTLAVDDLEAALEQNIEFAEEVRKLNKTMRP